MSEDMEMRNHIKVQEWITYQLLISACNFHIPH